jgi:hypothetical protein
VSTFRQIQQLVASGQVRISEHGYDELANDNLTAREVVSGVGKAQLIEDYPDFPKGASILLLHYDQQNRPIHSVWGIPKGHQKPAVLITAYRPDPAYWNSTFNKRKKP